MKQYHSNIFRRAVTMVVAALLLLCANIALAQTAEPPSLVINSSDKPVPAGGSVCSGSNVVVDAQYVGDTYDLSNWSVTGADGLDLECINEGHTLLIKDIKPGDYTVSLTLKNSDVIKTTFNVINSSTLDREETGCWDEYQVNATPAPTGFTGTWTGDGVSDKNNPMTTIKNPHGDYFWTVDNGVCKIQEKWTFVNNATGLGDIAVSQSGNCGSATLTVSHNAGVTPVWKVNGSETSATSSGTTTSTLTLTKAGTYSISVSASGEGGACPSEKFTSVTVSNLDNFDSAPEDVLTCSNNSANITATPYTGADKQYWTPSGSTITILPNSTSNAITVSGLAEGSTSTMTWTVEKDGCKASKVYTIKNGTATVTGNDDKLLCGTNNSTQIGINYSGNKTVKWENRSDATWTAPTGNSKQLSLTGIPEGTTTYRAYVYNSDGKDYGCVTDAAKFEGPGVAYVDIKVTRVIATASSAPNMVCSTKDNITLKGSSLSQAGAGATGYWTASGGTITSSSTNNEATATVSGAGTANFTWNVVPVITLKDGSTFSCPATATTSVTYGGGGEDAVTVGEFCAVGNKAVISVGVNNDILKENSATFVKSSGAGTPTITPTTGSKVEATVTGLANGTTEIRWTATTKSGCPLEAKIPIYNLDPPAPTADRNFVCDYNNVVTLSANSVMPDAVGTWSHEGGDGELIVDANSPNKATMRFASSSTDGVNIIGWQVSYKTPKTNLVCQSEKKYVTVENLAVTANAGNDIEICNYDMTTNTLLPNEEQNTATLLASEINQNFNPPAEGVWTGPGGTSDNITNSTSNETTVTNLKSGVNKFTWKVTRKSSINPDKECTATSEVIVYNSRVDAADAGDDIYVCDDYTTLSASTPNNGEGQWTLQGGHGYFTKSVDATHSVYEKEVTIDNKKYLAHADVYQRVGSTNKTFEYKYYEGETANDENVINDAVILEQVKDLAGDFAVQGDNFKSSEIVRDTPIGTHEVYESAVITYDQSPYIGQNFIIRADKYTYSYNGTSDIVYTYYILNGATRSQFNDGDIFDELLDKSNKFTDNAGRRVGDIENLYDDTYVLNPKVVRLQAGDNTFRWTVTRNLMPNGDGCSNYVTAHVYYIPVKVDAGSTKHLCENYGDLSGSANLGAYSDIDGITWKSKWIPSSNNVQIDYPVWPDENNTNLTANTHLNTHVSNLSPGKNTFALHAYVYHDDKMVCDAVSETLIWDNEVGDVDAGADDVYCGDDINVKEAGAAADGSYHSYDSDYQFLNASLTTSLRSGTGVSGVWTVVGGNGNIVIANSTSNMTSVTGLQRYVQRCTEDYWDTHTAANEFRWTVTYVNPETGEQCSNHDDVQIIWLAPGDPDAGEDQLVCGNDVNLNPLDKGCGAQMTWWDFTGSKVQGNTDNDETRWANPYWGGRAFLNKNELDVPLTQNEITALSNEFGNSESWYKKDILVFTDVVNLDGKYYRIQSTRTTYKTTGNAIIHVTVGYEVWECSSAGVVAGATEAPVTKILTGGTKVDKDNWGEQLSRYQIADEVFNAAIYDMPSPFDRTNEQSLSAMTFRWYKHNEMYSERQKKLVSCTSWDEVKITNLGALNDVMGGGEAATCNDWYELAAAYDGSIFKDKVAGNFTVEGEPTQWWEVIYGNGFFGESDSETDRSQKNIRVHKLAFGQNIFRWNVEMTLKFKDSENNEVNQKCSASDDMYVYNATPSVASVGEDREVCDDHTVLSANLPVRGHGTWIPTQGNATVGQSCADQQCDAYITNMSLGPNTFKWIVTNEYKSPKNPTTVYATCTNEDAITLYNHNLKADAGLDQYICSDEVELSGNDPLSVTSEGMYSSKDGEIEVPTGWWSQASTSKQTFYEFGNTSNSGQASLATPHVIVKPLSRSMSTFTWNIKWGDCPVRTDDVVVYDNLPDPDPEVASDFTTCSNFVELKANNHPTYPMDEVNRLEWTSSVATVTFDGNVDKKSNNSTTMAYNLQSGIDNTFTLAFYRTNGDPNPKLLGMPPNSLGAYKKAVENFEQEMVEWVGILAAADNKTVEQYVKDNNGGTEMPVLQFVQDKNNNVYGKALQYYVTAAEQYHAANQLYEKYLEDLEDYLEYIEKLKKWIAGQGEKPTDAEVVAYPEPKTKPIEPVVPTDTSKTNTADLWKGLGLWDYYVQKGNETQEGMTGEGNKYAKICKLSKQIVVHSNAINLRTTDIAECDYYVIRRDGPYTETSNNIFVTCVNKTDTVNAHPTGMKRHKMSTPTLGFSPASIHEDMQHDILTYTGEKSQKEQERGILRARLKSHAVSGVGAQTAINHEYYGILWTLVDGPNMNDSHKVKIDSANTMTPVLYNVMDGHYEFEVYAIRMNGADDYCESTSTVNVDIHIPTMAALEAKYQGIGDWTLDRTAMCQDNIDMQWMTATGITYTPSSTLEDGSTLKPGQIKGVQEGVEYSIFRIANNDTGGSDIKFTPNGYTAGKPGTRGYHVADLPYNATNLELFNCIDFTDPSGNPITCATSDTITIFNNSVYADADVRIAPDKSEKGYKWQKQEVNICTDTYELEANDPKGLNGNPDINQYETFGMWGFDDKDFKGFVFGKPMPIIADTFNYKTRVSKLLPSDNHQRANAFIWCVYKSILPPPCQLEAKDVTEWAGGSDKWYPMRLLCANGKTYRDFYKSDNQGRIYFYYTKTDDNGRIVPDTDGDMFYQVMFTDPKTKTTKYTFIKTTYTGVPCTTNGSTLEVHYVRDEKDDSNIAICIDEKTVEVPENGKSLMPFDRLRLGDMGNEPRGYCFASDALYAPGTARNNVPAPACLAFYSMEDIDNADPDISQRMKVSNFLYYMRNNCTNVNNGRMNWNYYVTMNDDDPENIYVWSDRQTTGLTYGNGTTYKCDDGYSGRLTAAIEQVNINRGGLNSNNHGNFNHFFKGALALIPSDTDLKWLKDNFTLHNVTHTGSNQQTNCWPTQFDGGGDDAPPIGWKGGGFKSAELFDPTNATPEVYGQWRSCVIEDDHYAGACGNTSTPSCGICGFAGNINFFTWALWGYGQPGAIPTEILQHKDNGDFGHFFDSPPPSIQGPTEASYKSAYTNFATKKGMHIASSGAHNLDNDIYVLPGWDRAYHVVNFKFNQQAFESYMDKLIQDISRQAEKDRDPIVAKAKTVDEFKEEADNSDKHYWCVARDTVFIYDNTITSMEIKPNFIVCDDKAQLIGENPGEAAEANASGYWTIKTNSQSVKFDSDEESTKPVANVHGLPPGETQFNWHIIRWNCHYDRDMFVYRNAVESNPGAEIYTCEDKAQLEAVQPSVGVGHWEFTQATPPGVEYGDATGPLPAADKPEYNNKAWVHNLQQGDNPFTWVVENPMPPTTTQTYTDANGQTQTVEVLEEINGHPYFIQESCPVGRETKVHDLRPDDAEIQTGTEVTTPVPTPPGP